MDMLNAVKSVLADVSSVSPSSEQSGYYIDSSVSSFILLNIPVSLPNLRTGAREPSRRLVLSRTFSGVGLKRISSRVNVLIRLGLYSDLSTGLFRSTLSRPYISKLINSSVKLTKATLEVLPTHAQARQGQLRL